MTGWQGQCPNIGNCSVADERRKLDGGVGDGLCPECGRALLALPPPPDDGRRGLPRAVVLGLAGLLVGGAVVAGVMATGVTVGGGDGRAGDARPRPVVGGENVILSLAGSNTLGGRLGPLWAEGFLKAKGCAAVRAAREGAEQTLVVADRCPGSGAVAIRVTARGTSTGIGALAAKEVDLAMASRRMESAEAARFDRPEDMLSAAAEHVVGLDGVAVVVHQANPVASLTIARLAELFAGRIASWAELGGPDVPVHVYARDENSGTFDTFRHAVLQPAAVGLAATARRFEDSRALADAVAADVGGIGFVGLPQIGATKAVAVSDSGGDPVFPTRFTVATEDYPLARRLYLYSSATPSATAADFLSYALSTDGQALVREVGFVALTVERVPGAASAGPPDYAAATAGAERLSTNLRFRPGGAELDSKATRDLDRISAHLATGSGAFELVLIGFTDNVGAAAANVALARSRARSVADALAQRGLKSARVLGLGPVLPIASNLTEEGRNRNRRVEVWVRPL